MGISHTSEFWQSTERHHDLAETYDRNIERTHPGAVTSKGMCVCLDYTHWCSWAATKVTYYRYNGPRVVSL